MINTDDVEFKKRVRISINKVVYERNLTNKTLAPFLNTTPTTLSNYRTMKNIPKASFVTKFCSLFECNREWLLTGKGRPFFDSGDDYPELINKYFKVSKSRARKIPEIRDPDSWAHRFNNVALPPIQRHPEICDLDLASIYNNDTSSPISTGGPQEINIDEAIGKTYKVLKSGTPYAVALYLNIQQFSSALDATKELHLYQERITNLETQVRDLRRQVDRLTAPSITAEQQDDSSEKAVM